jgi:putative transposase
MVEHVRGVLGPDRVSRRWVCEVLGRPRSTRRRTPAVPDDEPRLVTRMAELASQYCRYGCRRIAALLRAEGWRVDAKRVEQPWRREGLKVPAR